MTNRSLGLLAATAALAAFSGLHLEIAAGRALEQIPPGDARLQTGRTFAATPVNRFAKADRSERTLSSADGHTITFQHPDMPATTFAVRLWETVGATKDRPELKTTPKNQKAPKSKRVIACEGTVSVLTEVAKQLDAGRCVT